MNLPVPSTRKLRIVVSRMDTYQGKRIGDALLKLFSKNKFGGAAMLLTKEGYGGRGFVTSTALGLSAKLPIIIETAESEEKARPLLGSSKGILGEQCLITVDEVDVI